MGKGGVVMQLFSKNQTVIMEKRGGAILVWGHREAAASRETRSLFSTLHHISSVWIRGSADNDVGYSWTMMAT